MIALANDTPQTIKETWDVWEQICLVNQKGNSQATVNYGYGPMVLLDPGSQGFDDPTSYGYRLIFKQLEDYIKGMSLPSWHQWISYETKSLKRATITKLVIESIERSIRLREKYGSYSGFEADAARLYYVVANKLAIDVVDDAMELDEATRNEQLKSFTESLNQQLAQMSAQF